MGSVIGRVTFPKATDEPTAERLHGQHVTHTLTLGNVILIKQVINIETIIHSKGSHPSQGQWPVSVSILSILAVGADRCNRARG